jgi:oligosaccharide repeat unit polymerase
MATFILYTGGDDFLRPKTVFIISCYVAAFFCSAMVLPYVDCYIKSDPASESSYRSRNIAKVSVALVLFQLIAIFSAYMTVMRAIQFATQETILYASYGDNMFASKLRGVMANENYGIPVWVKILSQFKYINYIAPLFFMTLIKVSRKYKLLWILSTTLSCCYPIFFMERSGVLRIISMNIFFWLYWYRPKLKVVAVRIVIVAILLIPIFNAVLLLRDQADSGGGNIYTYFVGSLAGLDAFVSGTSGIVDSLNYNTIYVVPGGYKLGNAPVGQETLTEFFTLANKYLGWNYNIQTNQEYIYAPVCTNVYTAIRSFYQDYHMFSIPIFFIVGVSINLVFLRCMNGRSVWSGFLVAYLGYVSFYSIIANNFLIRDIVVTYILVYITTYFTSTNNYMFSNNSQSKATN